MLSGYLLIIWKASFSEFGQNSFWEDCFLELVKTYKENHYIYYMQCLLNRTKTYFDPEPF